MRSLRLVVSCTLLTVALTIAPASGASGEEPDGGGLLGQLVKNLTGSAAPQPTTSQKSDPSPESEQSKPAGKRPESKSARSSSAEAGVTESDSNDVSASAPGDPAQDDAYTVAQDSGATVLTPDINENDTKSPFLGVNVASDPTHGSYDAVTGEYTPDPGYNGTDTFTYYFLYQDANEFPTSNTATVTITVTPESGPELVANDDSYELEKDSFGFTLEPPVTDNDTALINEIVVKAQPTNGQLNQTSPTTFQYTPDTGFTGTDSFSYEGEAPGYPPSNRATVTLVVTPDGGGGGGGSEDNVVSVQADCSGEVTFRNLISEEVNVRYGPGDSLEGEFDLPAGQSQTITTNAKVLNYLAANESSGEQGFIEIPNCWNDNDDDDDDGDGDGDDDDGDDDDGDSDSDSNLPDTGAPSSDLLALGLTLAFLGSLLLVRPGGLRRMSTRL